MTCKHCNLSIDPSHVCSSVRLLGPKMEHIELIGPFHDSCAFDAAQSLEDGFDSQVVLRRNQWEFASMIEV